VLDKAVKVIEFERGPYGEIFPPPLVAGVDPDEALDKLAKDSAAMGSPITDMPTRGRSRQGMYNLALVYVHQLRLRDAIAGQLQGDPDARDLYQAVVLEGEPMSLRPLGMEALTFSTFAPVLQHVGENRWRIGVEGQGKTTVFDAPLDQVIAQAQAAYVKLSDADDEDWDDKISQALKRVPRLLAHEYWAWRFHQDGMWNRGGGFHLTALRGHGTVRLDLPNGSRILNTSRIRAVHMTDALARRARLEYPWPDPGDIIEWLTDRGVPLVDTESEPWEIGEFKVVWKLPASAMLGTDDRRYFLLVKKRGGELTLHPASRNGQRPNKRKKLASTVLGPQARVFLGDEIGRVALTMWAVWAGKLLKA